MAWTGFVGLGTVSGGVFTEISPVGYARLPFSFGSPAHGRIAGQGGGISFAPVTGGSPWVHDGYGFFAASSGGSPALFYPHAAAVQPGLALSIQPSQITIDVTGGGTIAGLTALGAQHIQAGGNGPLAISGAQSPANSYFSVHNGFAFGASADPFPAASELSFNDQVASVSPYHGFMVRTAFGGGNMAGNRNGIASYIALTASPNAADASQQNYVAGLFQGYANAPAKITATGGALFSGYAGGLWGINPNVFLTGNAKNFYGIYGVEADVSIQAGGNAAEKFGLMIVQGAVDAVQGTLDDAAIEIGNQDGTAPGWRFGLEFGGTSKAWALTATSTMIGATIRSQGPASPPIALNGVDFRNVTFQPGGKAFASPGFSVDPSGVVQVGGAIIVPLTTPASSAAAGVTGSILADAGFVYVCTAPNVWKRAALVAF